jgi:hypothetical protein
MTDIITSKYTELLSLITLYMPVYHITLDVNLNLVNTDS